MLYRIKSKKKLVSSLFNEEKLSLLIFHQVKLKKELILHRYFAGKLKICFIKTCRKQYYFLTYLVKKKTLINSIIIESNWRKTLFFTDLLHGNSKN